ncbi:hypothetical protein FQN60_007019 [Etheostoma spectabile]|uniref:Uncharacterized protein n=1 Tax=Etheostoma spectabile TaxID=54343 RepID=A0A5J5CAA6_9PERO|nr:hypothetical protein FQN60_007019 [Etheostoma spectabile]
MPLHPGVSQWDQIFPDHCPTLPNWRIGDPGRTQAQSQCSGSHQSSSPAGVQLEDKQDSGCVRLSGLAAGVQQRGGVRVH